ncbi:CRIB domain-containing protein RIC10-like isoform X2 [Phragmites australis]|uniref:CRIB domain-containing protein RIC10-like isoform X2 n=1 Tax=Phragmites australis TaxID=29695 RepID=UPI002D79C8E1|nr:CRIB domain-containing protein RIC10-like isoform X2 [Phragmites australis]
MAIAMKGIFKGFKIIAQIFTMHKEHEMEIGYPTDVRHVSHIGLGASDSCPSWMNEFRGLAEASAGGPVSSVAQSRQTSWASLDAWHARCPRSQPFSTCSRPVASPHPSRRLVASTVPLSRRHGARPHCQAQAQQVAHSACLAPPGPTPVGKRKQ